MSSSIASSSKIGPPAGLVVPNPKATGLKLPPSTPDSVFALQTKGWIALQATVAAGLQLPVDPTTFVGTYGTFADESEITNAMAVFSKINANCTTFGDPTTLNNEIVSFASASVPPASLYGHGVWLAQQLAVTSQTISSYYSSAMTLGATSANWQSLVSSLFSEAGVLGNAQTMLTLCQNYEGLIKTFYDSLTANVTAVSDYVTKDSNNVLTLAKGAVSSDATTLTGDLNNLSELNKKYIGYTAAACASPVISLMPPLFLLQGLADAAVFGTLAGITAHEISTLKSTISSLKTEKRQAAALVTTVTSFNNTAALISTEGQDLINAISRMSAGLALFNTELTNIQTQLNNFKSFNDFIQEIRMQAAISDWNDVNTYANQWVQTGFVTFQT